MKIVQFITRMDVLGGAQIHVFDLTKALISRGHKVIVIAAGFGKIPQELEKLGIEYYQLNHMTVPIRPVKDVRALFEVKTVLKKLNPDLIAIHSSKAGIIGRLAGKMLRIPTVFTAHSWSFSGVTNKMKKNLFITIEKLIGPLSSGIITVSQFDYDAAKAHKIAFHVNMKMIHNGIHDIEKSVPKTSSDNVKMVMVARFAYPKDHLLLLKALKDIPHENWQLTLIGDGPLLTETKAYASTCEFANNIIFAGECANVFNYLAEADIFLLITRSEGLPISIIEAMRANLPIIASNVGGVKELIDHQISGLLVPRDNVNNLRTAILSLLSDEKLRKRLGIEARRKYKEMFTFSIMLNETENYYKKVLSHGRKTKQGVHEG